MAKSNYVLRAAIAACFSVAAGQAAAVLDLSVATPTGISKIAKEIPSTTTTLVNAANQFDIKVAVPPSYGVTASNPLYIKMNLTGGASFVANPTSVRCGTAAAANSMSAILQLGGAGTSFVVYSVETGVVSGTCSATMGNLTIAGLGNVGVSATVEYKNGLDNVVTGVLSNYVTFVTGMVASVITADGNVIVDATTGSIHLTTSSNKGTTGLATLGQVKYTQVGTSAASAGLANNVSAGDVISTATVTVNGPAIAAALAANGTSGIFLDASTSGCTTKSYTIGTTATNSVTFTNVSLTNISAGVWVCLNVSGGTTVIATGQMTATVGGVPQSSVTADFTTTSNALETLTSNGLTRNAYLVNASTSTAKTSIIRLINTGTVAAAFTATAYAEDTGAGDGNPVGFTPLGTANSVMGTIEAGGALNLTSAQLESKLGFTPSSNTSKYRIVFSAGATNTQILNYTQDVATGTVVLSQSGND